MSISYISLLWMFVDFFPLRTFDPTFVFPYPSPFERNLTNKRLTQVLGTLQIHFWSMIWKGKVKTRNQFKNSTF